MKNIRILFAASFILLFASSMYAQKTAHRFIDQVKKQDHAVAMTLPGWLVRTGFQLAIEDEIEESEGLADIVDGVKSLRFAVIDEIHNIEETDIDKLVNLSIQEEQMELFAKVRDDGELVQVLVKEVKNRIRAVVIIAYSSDELAVLNIETNISLTDLENARFSFNEEREESN